MLVFLREIKVVIFYGCNGAMPTFSVYNGRMAKEVSKLTASLNLELINLKSSKILVKNWCHPNSNKTKNQCGGTSTDYFLILGLLTVFEI
jgi:hypothetical protein